MVDTTRSTDVRVQHIPQVPGEPFIVHTMTTEQAEFIVDVLAEYDLFQFEQGIKPDYSNVSWIDVWDGEAWEEYEDYGD